LSETGDGGFAIEASGLSRRYGRRWALANVSLEVPRGASVLLAGRNGSGKSTLLRLLATAIRPDRGTARIEGFDLVSGRDQVRRRTALLGHHANTWEALTALQNLAITADVLGRGRGRDELMPLLDEVGLADRADDAVGSFSAGMRKRLSIARMLLQVEGEPSPASVVLLDEPYNQLDPPGFRFVDRMFERLRARGATMVIATHLIERGAGLCDLGIVLEGGRVRWSGRAADLPSQGGLEPAALAAGVA
ncbi:MAG TPA: ABC transporter ATP-binding protein, partial [Thermoanaerobaculia bacterium]|nr:ABC transporter ATP-binding protein [Thermoanaerobaculia bacterium]